MIARAVECPKFRATYFTTTRVEAKERAWSNDTQTGFVDVLREFGTPYDATVEAYDLGGVIAYVRQQELAIDFSNGGRIDLFGADDERAINKKRGIAKHVFWIDEAQDFLWLSRLYKGVIMAARADFDAEVWLTGTPGRDCTGMFWEVTRDDNEPRLPGWEVHSLSMADNPRFGASEEERWNRVAVAALEENGWSPDDPDFQREYMGKWVKSDARFVYAANQVPEHELVYAPQRLLEDGFPDLVAALADLPDRPRREYFLCMGADLGTRDDFALVIWAWSLADPVLYELASWKRAGLDYDEMANYLRAARDQVHIGIVVADAGGGGKPAVMGWSKKWVDRYNLPIIEATKQNKQVAIKQLNTDVRKGHVKVRAGSPLLLDWKNHRWAPIRDERGNLVEDPRTHKFSNCADSGLYSAREAHHHRYREPELTPETGSPQWVKRQEQEMLDNALENAGRQDFFGW